LIRAGVRIGRQDPVTSQGKSPDFQRGLRRRRELGERPADFICFGSPPKLSATSQALLKVWAIFPLLVTGSCAPSASGRESSHTPSGRTPRSRNALAIRQACGLARRIVAALLVAHCGPPPSAADRAPRLEPIHEAFGLDLFRQAFDAVIVNINVTAGRKETGPRRRIEAVHLGLAVKSSTVSMSYRLGPGRPCDQSGHIACEVLVIAVAWVLHNSAF